MKKARYAKAHIEISSICNLQCSFCPEVVREKKLMEPAVFRRLLEQAAPMAEQIALHLMGDPLVHPALTEIIRHCREVGVSVFLVTNGVLLKDKTAELLLDPVFRQVNFSLHSYADNFPERDPVPYLEKVFSFTERALEVRPELYVNFRLWNLQAPRGVGERNREVLDLVQKRFGKVHDLELDVRAQKSRKLKGRLYLHFDTEFTWPSMDLPEIGTKGTCYGLRSHFGILVNGTVVPCCLDKEGVIPLGNAMETPLAEILSSPRAEAIRRGFLERKLVEPLCQRCPYIERFGA